MAAEAVTAAVLAEARTAVEEAVTAVVVAEARTVVAEAVTAAVVEEARTVVAEAGLAAVGEARTEAVLTGTKLLQVKPAPNLGRAFFVLRYFREDFSSQLLGGTGV